MLLLADDIGSLLILVTLAGVLALVAGTVGLGMWLRRRNWPTVRGRVVERTLEESHAAKGGTHYFPKLSVAYEVHGKKYTAQGTTTYSATLRDQWGTREQAERALAKIPDVVDVKFDPDDPASGSIAILTTPPIVSIVVLAAGAFFVGLGAWGLLKFRA